ncbi:hypothetical protein GEMRC1_003310 [Eukaryota sp. GEM-RC1]
MPKITIKSLSNKSYEIDVSPAKRYKSKVYKPYPMPSFDRVGAKHLVGFYNLNPIQKKWVLILNVPVQLSILYHDRTKQATLVFINTATAKIVQRVPIRPEVELYTKTPNFIQLNTPQKYLLGLNFSTALDASSFLKEVEEIQSFVSFLSRLTKSPSFLPTFIHEQIRMKPTLRSIPLFEHPSFSSKVPLSQIDSHLRCTERLLMNDVGYVFYGLFDQENFMSEKVSDEVSNTLTSTFSEIDSLLGTNLMENMLQESVKK